MLVDYHIHTKLCGHASGEMEEYVAVALHKGFREIGFADHLPAYFRTEENWDPTNTMRKEDLPLYIGEVNRLRRTYPDLTIRLGIEADYIPGREQDLARFLAGYSFDYIYGSIHFLDGWGYDDDRFIDGYQGRDIDDLYRRYFAVLQGAARSGLFDILAHPDLIKKFNFRPQGSVTGLYEETARIIREGNLCIEINTAGLRYPAGEVYPAPEFLEICRHYQIPVTLGSDAHKPEQVGADFDRSIALLKEVGYREIAVFEGRKRSLVPLP